MAGEEVARDRPSLHRIRGIVDDLVVRAGSNPSPVLQDAITQLDVALEELSVALEELHEQNDELTSTRAQLEDERRYYQALFDLAPDAYLITDPEGIVHAANRAARRLLAAGRIDVVGQSLARFVPVEERPGFREGLRLAGLEGTRRDWSFPMVPYGHGAVEISAHVVAGHDEQGRVTDLRWLLRDVTDARRAQQHMQERFVATREEAEALRELDRWKDAFMTAAAHDLRSPLTIIEAATETLTAVPELPPETRDELLSSVRRQATRLHRLLDDLLDLDRFTRGPVQPDRQRIRVDTLVHRVIDAMAITSHPLTVTGARLVARLDARRVEQIVTNLLGNAVQHTPAGTPIEVHVQATDGLVVLVCDDTGPGLDPDRLDVLFHPFVTAPTHEHDPRGTGLGLSLVQLFAELHGGAARAEALPDGARFVVELPSDEIELVPEGGEA